MKRSRPMSVSDLFDEVEQEEKRQVALPLSDPNHLTGFVYDEEYKGWCIWWGGYEYFIQQERIDTPTKLLAWLHHLTEKSNKAWRGMTPWHIHLFIDAVCTRNEWKIHPV